MAPRHGSTTVEEIPQIAGFRGQRGGKRGAVGEIPETKHDLDPTSKEVLAEKSVSLAQLIAFCRRFSESGKLSLDPSVTCWQVVEDVIIPETYEDKCCYRDYALGDMKPPQCFVSHWMGLSFRELVMAVVSHACGGLLKRDLLEKKAFSYSLPDEVRDKSYWICMFAANFHRLHGTGHPVNDAATLDYILSQHKSVLCVVDPQLTTLSRIWCCLELFTASEMQKEITFAGYVDECFAAGEGVEEMFVGIRWASSYDAVVTESVRNHVQQRVGLDTFDKRTRAVFVQGVYNVLWQGLMKSGNNQANFVAMRTLLGRGLDVDTPTRHGESALLWASQYGQPAMVKLLLDSKADAGTSNVGGWVPLHFAAQLGTQASVEALLAARADPNVVSQVGRSPLMEAAERGYANICDLLLDAGADINLEDHEGNKAASFHETLNNETLSMRLGWMPRSTMSPTPPPELA